MNTQPITIKQTGEIDGTLTHVSDGGDMVPIRIEVEGKPIDSISLPQNLAKDLATHLNKYVRFAGEGTWTRRDDGWHLEQFDAISFEILPEETLSEAVAKLRAIQGWEWGENAIEELLSYRYDEE